MFNQLQRAINLSQKTGDKLIVFDSRNPESSYVLIPFDEYEKSFYEGCDCCCDDECCMPDEVDDDDYFDDKEFFEKKDEIKDEEYDGSNIDMDDKMVDSNSEYDDENSYLYPVDSHLTEEERIDKINRDLSMSIEENLSNEGDSDKLNFLEGNFGNREVKSDDRMNRGNNWNIPRNIKASAEEVVEEDRRYLEEITF